MIDNSPASISAKTQTGFEQGLDNYLSEHNNHISGLVIYKEHKPFGKILSNTYSDLLYIPNYKHYQW